MPLLNMPWKDTNIGMMNATRAIRPTMQTSLYFAYGSNLLSHRLLARCPSARALSLASTRQWTVSFTKPGGDGSGKAGLVERADATHPGVVYEIAAREMPDLDRHEGVGHGYARTDAFSVTLQNGETTRVSTYLPTRHDAALKPFDWYLALCVAGASEHGFDTSTLHRLCRHPHQRDTDHSREGRRLALEALAAAGHHDWQKLITY
jgi:gamma-glutamylcyclotransferase